MMKSTSGTILGLVTWGLATACLSAEAARPNLLFIFSDDHAEHAISAYGSKVNRTPHIDRLAREGVRFQNSFCVNSTSAPRAAPRCSPGNTLT